jgi:hypothetical protein
MRPHRRRETISAVGDRLRLHLDLERDGEPVSGHVGLADADSLPFTGYADLIAKLQAIRAGDIVADGGPMRAGAT